MLPGFPQIFSILGGSSPTEGPQVIAVKNSINSSTSIVTSIPNEAQEGDLIIAFVYATGTAVTYQTSERRIFWPVGWALVEPGLNNAAGTQHSNGFVSNRGVWATVHRYVQEGDSLFTWSTTINSDILRVVQVVIRGGIIGDYNKMSPDNSPTGTNVGSVNSSSLPALLVQAGFFSNSQSSNQPVVTAPEEQLTEWLNDASGSIGSTTWVTAQVGTEIVTATGSSGSRSWGYSGGSSGRQHMRNMVSIIEGVAPEMPPEGYEQHGSGTGSFIVPAGVETLHILGIGQGAASYKSPYGDWCGAGGAAAWGEFPVTPGETLTFQVAPPGQFTNSFSASDYTEVKRGATVILRADYAKCSWLTASPGFLTETVPGQAENCIGPTTRSGYMPVRENNQGGTGANPLGNRPFSNSGINYGVVGVLNNKSLNYGTNGRGCGAWSSGTDEQARNGNGGLIIFAWGLNRGFGGVAGSPWYF